MKLRPATLDDLEAAYEVVCARDIADIGVIDYRLHDLRDEWQLSDLDLAQDVQLVVDQQGGVVGYGIVANPGAFAIVRPDSEGRGAGSLLLGWVEQRERELGRSTHRQYVASANRTAREFLSARGYRLARSNIRMVRQLDGADPAGEPPPEGIVLRPFAPEDIESIHGIDDRAFAADPGYEPESLTLFREEHLEGHDSAPELSLVAWGDDHPVGFLLARRWSEESTGYVDVLAVEPGQQGRGIGRALLLHAFAAFARAGLREAQLGVSSANPTALKLYETAGMTPRFRGDIYEKPVSS